MAEILKNVRLYSGACDLTGVGNKIDGGVEVEERDATTWGSYDPVSDRIWQEVVGGNAKGKLTGAGHFVAGDPSMVDDAMWANLGGAGAWSALPAGSVYGDLAWLANVMESQYKLLGEVGAIAPWDASWTTSGPQVRGVVAHPPGVPRTATGVGTAVQHVAVPTGKSLYAALHVLSIAGTAAPSIAVKIQSDDNSGFTSPTDRLTFTTVNALGPGEVKHVDGAHTDTYYRASWTITGTTPSFLFLVTLGVSI